MSEILTAKEFMMGKPFSISSIQNMMIEFAKLHVEEALKEASAKAKLVQINTGKLSFKTTTTVSFYNYEREYIGVAVNISTIKNAYPLTNIK